MGLSWQPMSFASVVKCAGQASAGWKSDLALSLTVAFGELCTFICKMGTIMLPTSQVVMRRKVQDVYKLLTTSLITADIQKGLVTPITLASLDLRIFLGCLFSL